MDGDVSRKFQHLAQAVARFLHIGGEFKAALADLSEASADVLNEVGNLEGVGSAGLAQLDLYAVIEDGNQQIVGQSEVATFRRTWDGTFLLDLPLRVLQIRRARTPKTLRLGREGLGWGAEQVLAVGMCQPGTPFGFYTFSKRDPKGSGIGHVKTLTRYVCAVRRAIGDSGKKSVYIHKTKVDPNESPSR